jgi:hypothetical protein
MRPAARLLTILAMVAAFGLALRALLGPFSLAGLRVASPLGIESVFACVFLALLFLRARPTVDGPQWSLPLAAALAIIALAYAPNLRDPFLSDDYILAARATFEPARLGALFHTAGGDGSFRPLGYVYFGMLRQLFGANSLAWHSVALAIHLTNCALLYFIVRTLWGQAGLAALAALVFGLHGTRPEAVTWSAGNFDLLACGFTLAATLCALRRKTFAACVLVALAILCKESAYAAPAVMLGFAAAAGRARQSRAVIVAAVAVCAAMFLWRWTMFHGPGGYIDPATGQAQVLSFHLGSALKAVLLRVWALMLFPVNWAGFGRSLALALAILTGAAAVLLGAPPARRVSLALLATTVGALLPAYHLALIGQDLNGSRILYLPAVGFCVLCAHLVHGKRLPAAGFIIASAVMLRVNLNAWHANAILADRICAGTANEPPMHDRNGIVLFANGYAECRELKKR